MSRQQFALDYIDVATRIIEFRTKHPEGSLQQVSLDFREVNGTWWVIYTAAAYRNQDDTRPGMGTAWEPIPGRTNFTRDSEVQNAETAAWGRAIVAAMAADTKRGIASAEEVRNARERQAVDPAEAARNDLMALCQQRNLDVLMVAQDFADGHGKSLREADESEVRAFIATVRGGEAPLDRPRKVSELDAERNPDDPEAERQARLAEAKVRRDAAGVDSSGKKRKGEPTMERLDTTPTDDPWTTSA